MNHDRIRAEASSKSINITIRDIMILIKNEDIEETGKPLRDKLSRILTVAFKKSIPLPKTSFELPLALSNLYLLKNGIMYFDVEKMGANALLELCIYIENLESNQQIPSVESFFYIKYIQKIFEERANRGEKNDKINQMKRNVVYSQKVSIIIENLISKIPNYEEIKDIEELL